VVGAGSGSSNQDQETRKLGDEAPRFPDRPMEGSTNGDTDAIDVVGSVRTLKRTLELAGRVGQKKWGILIDLGSTGNFVSAQVCTASRLKVEEDPTPEELTLANGSKSQTE